VEPLRKQLRKQDSRPDDEGRHIQQALHICRGHFKDYRDSGLFGKHFGIYWWDMHMRGSKEYGEIVKDYEIEVPAQEARA